MSASKVIVPLVPAELRQMARERLAARFEAWNADRRHYRAWHVRRWQYLDYVSARATRQFNGAIVGNAISLARRRAAGEITPDPMPVYVHAVGMPSVRACLAMTQYPELHAVLKQVLICERRFDDKRWIRPVWHGELFAFKHHFVHVATSDRTKVAYYPTVQHFLKDRLVTLSPGRYLRKFYPHLTDAEIKRYAEEHAKMYDPAEIHWAYTEEECIKAIAEGPTESCMSNGYHSDTDDRKDYSWFHGHIHPAAVYGEVPGEPTDTAVAYTMDKDGRINARVIVNKKKKLMARGYGNYAPLIAALEKQGYKQARYALDGCRIRRIANKNGKGIILPYVDAGIDSGGGYLHYIDYGDYLILTADCDYRSTYEGFEGRGVDDLGVLCDCCETSVDEDDLVEVYDGRLVCPACCRDHYTIAFNMGSWDLVPNREVEFCHSDGSYYYISDENLAYYGLDFVDAGLRYNELWSIDDMRFTSQGWVHVDEAVQLDKADPEGNIFAHPDDVVVTCDGMKIHKNSAVWCWYTEKAHHKDDAVVGMVLSIIPAYVRWFTIEGLKSPGAVDEFFVIGDTLFHVYGHYLTYGGSIERGAMTLREWLRVSSDGEVPVNVAQGCGNWTHMLNELRHWLRENEANAC